MTPNYYLATVRHLCEESFTRLMVNLGINQSDMDVFRGSALWDISMRIRLRRVCDALTSGVCDMAMLPKVDVPAEMAAACIAMTVNPGNWLIASSWQAGLRPARDLVEGEETVQIERVSAGKMFALICHADAALRGAGDYEKFATLIADRFTVKSPK